MVRRSRQPWSKLPRGALLLTVFGLILMAALTQSASAQKKPLPAPATQESKDENIEAARSELLQLLRLSPKLSLAISADPTLLADEAYVSRNNPELAEFLHNHAEVVRNPEFYLFFPNQFPAKRGRPRFEATVWPELQGFDGPPNGGWDTREIIPFLVFVLILAAFLWIFRIVLENIKWNKLSRMQNELYGKLLEKCSTNEELLASFRGSGGKPFFDLAAIEPPTSNPLARVFLLLQFGIVLTLAGGILLGFLYSRAGDPRAGDARFLLGLGTLVFALGIGLIISAVVSYLLARHLGLLPQRDKAKETGASENTTGG
jgi:hypothetical protein